MTVDSQQQRVLMLRCIEVTASTVRVDASDAALQGHSALVQLRRDVEAAVLAEPPPEPQV
jgi:hypothetical protein